MTRSLSKVCFFLLSFLAIRGKSYKQIPRLINVLGGAEISLATGVAEGTIRNSYKDLYPHLPKIAPSWYAKEEDLKNLSSP